MTYMSRRIKVIVTTALLSMCLVTSYVALTGGIYKTVAVPVPKKHIFRTDNYKIARLSGLYPQTLSKDTFQMKSTKMKYFIDSVSTNRTDDTADTPKSRFEAKMAKLEKKFTDDPMFYARGNIPDELMRMASDVFHQFPLKLLPEYKSPCWKVSTDTMRCLPYCFLGGFPKCATTDLWDKIVKHPDIVRTAKEPQWWTRGPLDAKGVDKYIGRQTTLVNEMKRRNRTDLINCDGSALTLQDNKKMMTKYENRTHGMRYITADIIRAVLPDVKIIAILRNPTDRAYSAYIAFDDNWRRTKSPRDFHIRIVDAIKDFHHCTDNNHLRHCAYTQISPHVNTGCYSFYLRDWFKRFPRHQFYIIRTEDWSRDRSGHMKDVFKFLGLDPLPDTTRHKMAAGGSLNKRKTSDKRLGPMLQETREILDDFFRPCNQDLSKLLDDERYLWQD